MLEFDLRINEFGASCEEVRYVVEMSSFKLLGGGIPLGRRLYI